jgi:hypothetical protein
MHFSTRNLVILLVRTRQVHCNAGVAKLVDAPDLGSGAARRGGSSPSTRTTFLPKKDFNIFIASVCQVLKPVLYLASKV